MIRWRVVVLSSALATAQTLPTGYAGSEACKVCHEDIYNAFTKSPHHAVDVDAKRGWQGRACESCHGAAQAHAEGPSADNIQDPAKLAVAAADKVCLNCHLNQPTQVGRLESSHAKNQISCTTCHKVHASEPLVVRKAALDEAAALQTSGSVAIDDEQSIAGLPMLDGVADTVGGEIALKLLAKVKAGGNFGYASVLPGNAAEINPTVKISRVFGRPDASKIREFADDVRDGRFVLPIGRRLQLRDAVEAHRLGEKGGVGKILMRP
jgi:hypothetical protein